MVVEDRSPVSPDRRTRKLQQRPKPIFGQFVLRGGNPGGKSFQETAMAKIVLMVFLLLAFGFADPAPYIPEQRKRKQQLAADHAAWNKP